MVALTTATASTPGRRPSSRTASVLIRDTTRCAPHCSSTWAITLSAMTSVTSPTNLLRADRPTADGSSGAAACARANPANWAPSTTLRPAASSVVVSCPARTHLRTVSSLTPSRRAASDNRNCGMPETLSPQLRKSYAGRAFPMTSARSSSSMTF
ncbi:hypothetical protein DV20_03460 [Amycolatopsis rifamycinica]|uniref:Uncharacterized protein n=1 Tax=Amycolatopsis rifamycinica TaxID=287986 RepID=A0A066U7V3_9PSEU|nr:hypothetical protein DV20_03460 [Amycolatopsis rifamycinica]